MKISIKHSDHSGHTVHYTLSIFCEIVEMQKYFSLFIVTSYISFRLEDETIIPIAIIANNFIRDLNSEHLTIV